MKQLNNLTIATLGGHSALEIFLGAKESNFRTLAILQKGREKTYTKYYQNLVDDHILVDKFDKLTSNKIIQLLKSKNVIFIPHRYVQVYVDLSEFENNFNLRVYGNKYLLKYEDREGKYNQYQILQEGNLDYPKRFTRPDKIDRLVLVKAKEAVRNYERSFFFAGSYQEYKKKSQKLIDKRVIMKDDLAQAVIEEYLIGAQVNFNFFYSPLSDKIELLGTDTRRQTNIDGLLRIPAAQQIQIEHLVNPSYIESGHCAVTVKESLLEKAFDLAEKLIKSARKIVPPGIIGPFALQTVVLAGPPKEKIVVFDISLRIPGSPGSVFTPYSYYLYDRPVSFGERIAMEIKKAMTLKRLDEIIT